MRGPGQKTNKQIMTTTLSLLPNIQGLRSNVVTDIKVERKNGMKRGV
jgi:hypothetical protein